MEHAEEWSDVAPASLKIGDVVRVKKNAYSSKAGLAHNGRLVKVLDIGGGDVVVTTIDLKVPYICSARHAAYKLEKKVAV